MQWAAFSGVLRSHDRGMSAGTCYDTDSCSHVRIWETPTKYFEAMRDAMQTRDAMLPYVYTMARQSFDTGLGALRPMYYEYPELDSAYTCDATGNVRLSNYCTHLVNLRNRDASTFLVMT